MDYSRFEKLSEKFRGRSVKERVGVLLAVLTICYALWDAFLVQPMFEKEENLLDKISGKNQQLSQVSDQIQQLIHSDNGTQIRNNVLLFNDLVKQMKVSDEQLMEITSSLIPPDQVVNVLKELLARNEGINIRRLEGLPAMPIYDLEETGESKNLTQTTKAWRHGIRIEFSGSYLATLNYLKAMENLNWKFQWDSIVLDADNYPTVNSAVKIYTLSLNKEWIGV